MLRILVSKDKAGPMLSETEKPEPVSGEVLLRTLVVGIDGTDREIAIGDYGEPPEREEGLTIGHEALAQVEKVGENAGDFAVGELVVPTVRRGCGTCVSCLNGESDMCFTGLYKERGIKGLNGYMSEFFLETPDNLVPVPKGIGIEAVLTEPLSVALKAIKQCLTIQGRIRWACQAGPSMGCKSALVAGTGTLGILATLLLRNLNMEVTCLGRSTEDAPDVTIIKRAGADYINTRNNHWKQSLIDGPPFDLMLEATGVPRLAFSLLEYLNLNGIYVMLGISGDTEGFNIDGGQLMNRLVLGNQVIFGSVNSNRRHFERALEAMRSINEKWEGILPSLITGISCPSYRLRCS